MDLGWDWKLIGGAWPWTSIDKLVEGVNSKKHQSRVERQLHAMERKPNWEWRRFYKEDGSIDYDLVETSGPEPEETTEDRYIPYEKENADYS